MEKTSVLDFVCVIHGNLYSWDYVQRLYSMLSRNLSINFRFNVFAEASRPVPNYMVKHNLIDWPGIQGKRSAWWYKMQIFDLERQLDQVIYLDLDTVIVNNLDWIKDLDTDFFWTIRDFKYLWRPDWNGINSSFMRFDSKKFAYIWEQFSTNTVFDISRRYRGDQDYLTDVLKPSQIKFIEPAKASSWRWQVYQGGLNTKTRQYLTPNQPTRLANETSLVIFHGSPKPHEVCDDLVQTNWC